MHRPRMHEGPQSNDASTARRSREGMTLAIETMVNVGSEGVRMGDDGWSVYSDDGSLAAHFEFTVAVGKEAPRILTPWHED